MQKFVLFSIMILALSAEKALAQQFSFYATLQSGREDYKPKDWELGLGPSPTDRQGDIAVSGQFGYDSLLSKPHWNANGSQAFRIGWDAASNRSYVTVFNNANVASTIYYANLGVPMPANTIWTLPAGSFYVSAAPQNQASSILLSGLSLSPGASLVGGSLPAVFGASQQNRSGARTELPAPLVIDAASNGGSWYLSGSVQFTGLVSQSSGQAKDSDLQLMIHAIGTGSNVPEPVSISMTICGLIALALARHLRVKRTRT